MPHRIVESELDLGQFGSQLVSTLGLTAWRDLAAQLGPSLAGPILIAIALIIMGPVPQLGLFLAAPILIAILVLITVGSRNSM